MSNTETSKVQIPAHFSLPVPAELIRSIVGGSHCLTWAINVDWEPEILKLTLTERDTGRHFVATPESFARALGMLVTHPSGEVFGRITYGYPHLVANLLGGKYDGWDGDAFVQLAVLGEIKYG